ncbi:hypothetical protein G7B40_012685 [Aetokthonos hydrillicola Thurmond2011]|jgi:hypothetical protein|uniref:Uncharacterized protein n=1 Tax=Aetokthonos hydrillicola Thurmond2011 TaxID=2712845 RepID=A0AAP5I5I1_9CYAN|nr:hypothetical protein [Aetokthonos hydrillicola]MBO3461492.1 hypothetical protein [Aetokthonos hydrillicola CCALA 1050]MBW4584869.1 hypothetical protein [Aetokthonos hydrillicola CCALA 1050]MDR9895418.1 hypothetical protein [Aetokthonos hydrillicola Thurmond2011]
MSKVYTTKELIQILADERQACLTGKRLKLPVTISGNPLIDHFIKTNGLEKFTAYQDFKALIHDYQREYHVSGIIWQSITVKDEILHYPQVDSQLAALPSDIELLKSAKNSILEFWHKVTLGMDLYLSINNNKQYQPINTSDVERIVDRTEWASLCKWENSNFLEIILQLAWGKPEEASYKRGFPASGSEYIHAVNPGNYPIG